MVRKNDTPPIQPPPPRGTDAKVAQGSNQRPVEPQVVRGDIVPVKKG